MIRKKNNPQSYIDEKAGFTCCLTLKAENRKKGYLPI